MPSSSRPVIRYLVVALGLGLWVYTLAYNRPLFLDEANLARNLYDRSFAGLFSPLDHEQYAPPLYLLLTKALATLVGYHEWVLRLPAFLGGLVAVAALLAAGRILHLGVWTALPLALLFANPTVLRYVTEVKPYGLDLGLAAAVLWAHLRWPAGMRKGWLIAGVLLPWLSLPAVFLLATVGVMRIIRDWRFAFIAGTWALSFGLLYLTVLRPAVGSDYLNDYHAAYFLRPPTSAGAVSHLGYQLFTIVRLSFGYTIVSLAVGTGAIVYAFLVPTARRYIWLLAPLGMAMVASGFRLYTLLDRLLLFALPGIWLLAAVALRCLYDRLVPLPRTGLVVAVLIALGGANIHRAILQPYRFSGGRWLTSLARESKVHFFAHASAVPVLDYYLQVKPETAGDIPRPALHTDESFHQPDGRVLFDNVRDPGIRREIEQYGKRATERGCNTDYVEQSGSGSLRIRCPERNYDR